MTDAAKISEALTMSIDMSKAMAEAGPSADKLGDLFNTRFREKLASAAISTNIADKWSQQLAHGLNGGLDGIEKQLVNKLSSVATSIERFNFGPSVINKLGSVVQEAIRFQMDGVLAAARQMESVIASITTPRIPQQSFSPMGAFGQGMPAGTLNPTGAFGHGGGVNSQTAIYGAFGVSSQPTRVISGAFGQGNATVGMNQSAAIQGAFGQGLLTGQLNPSGAFGHGGGNIGVNQASPVLGAFGITAPAGRSISGAFGIGSGSNMAPDMEAIQRRAAIMPMGALAASITKPTFGDRVVSTQIDNEAAFARDSRGAGILSRAQAHSDQDFAQERRRMQADRSAERLAKVERDALSYSTGGYTLGYDGEEGTQVIGGRRDSIDPNRGRNRAKRRATQGRLSRQDSHSARFAAQNIGFGVDDAIQSYHYGGVGGAIRAASNNATAIAGMLISNPVTAAASVIGISIVSAAVPVILSKFGADKAFSDKSATERFNQRHRVGTFFDDNPEKTYQTEKSTSEQTWVANQQAKLVGRTDDNHRNYLRATSQRGGATAFIDDMASKQVQNASRIKQNQDELDSLKANQVGLQLRASTEWSGTAKKELERNLSRQEELERDNRTANDERTTDAKAITIARKNLPQNIARQAVMSKYDWETNSRFNRGDLTLEEHDKRLEGRAALERKNISFNAASYKDEDYRRALLKVDNDLLEAKADPDRARNIQLASSSARQANRNYSERYSGDTSRESQANWEAKDAFETNYRDEVSGNLSRDERVRRDGLVQSKWVRDSSRAGEDDITDINPERNPYKNQLRQLERIQEDISLRPKEQQTEQYRAALIAAERRHEDMRPQARSFISQSVVGSLQDEELRARMTGNYGPAIKRDDHKGEDQAQLIAKIEELRQQLQLEAQQIGH